ncbi:MAG: hypothetical protein EAZ70_03575 [Runella slithyformis]|nr:MAG: hypothetical protein EAY79_03035 [Runella slithyformis]TAE93623.1 MAG: hypothetical protein EAZ80_11320 [Runella slithyformis]TAF29008.1 MAG: hypothetical protein EAZ70_03575 [Runella slithyformis]TAF46467.1 MAG: hypothetical protein EAZ63_09495 [Runella slithyformis]TAF82588.1 MAG: hypothetical protein EAZ50_03575 [Runella slithyformis]
MKHFRNNSIILLAALIIVSCKTDMIERLDELNFQTGAYMRTVPFEVYRAGSPVAKNQIDFFKSKFNEGKFETVLEAVTANKADDFAKYDLSIRFVDNTPANGNKSTTFVPFRSIPASAFAKDAKTGYPRHTLVITASEVLAATKVAISDMTPQPLERRANGTLAAKQVQFKDLPGDEFQISAVMTLADGRTYSAANTGQNITGGAFYASPFLYRVVVAEVE